MRSLILLVLVLAAACSSESTPFAPTAPYSTLSIYTDSVPAAPTNAAVAVDSSDAVWAYVTFTWTDNTGGRARYQLFTYYNGVPNAYAVTEGLTGGLESLSTKVSFGEQDFYLRALIYINDVTGVSVYSAPVGPISVSTTAPVLAAAKPKGRK